MSVRGREVHNEESTCGRTSTVSCDLLMLCCCCHGNVSAWGYLLAAAVSDVDSAAELLVQLPQQGRRRGEADHQALGRRRQV